MSEPDTSYPDEDNDVAYWDAFWSSRRSGASVRRAWATPRNRVLPGLLMLVGVVCCALAPNLALVNLALPAGALPGVEMPSLLDIGRPSDDQLTRLRLFLAAGLACALVLLWVRHWLVGAPVRLIFLGSITYPGFLCARLWLLTRQQQAAPGTGLYLWTAGLAMCLLGALIPAYARPRH